MNQKDLKNNIYWILLPLAFFLFSCAVPERRACFMDNRDCSKISYYIDKEDWDSCYMRGCAYMDCNCLDGAIEEFKKAINERPRDRIRARTYGMHFIRYFPHRELGIIYYQMGQIQEAIEELERSLQDSPSSKGKYFLNQARKAWLLENDLDHLAPTIHVTNPKEPFYYTNQSELLLEGYAEDDWFVSGISIKGEPIFIELSAKTIQFTQTIPLEWGRNSVTITTIDLFDRGTQKQLEIILDKTGPFIHFNHSDLESAWLDGGMLVQGIAFDDSGVEFLSINGKIIDLKDEETAEFSHWIPLTKDMKQITLIAKDIAGNKTRGYIDLSSGERTGRLFKSSIEGGYIPQKNRQPKEGGVIRIAALEKSIPCLISSNDRRNPGEASYITAGAPPSKTRIKIDPLPRVTIFNEIYLNGEIRYQTEISDVRIFINNKPVPLAPYDLEWMGKILGKIKKLFGTEELKSLSLSKIIELDLGQNEIIIEVCDDDGLLRSDPIYVQRKKDEMLEQKYRLSVAVMPVNDTSRIPRLASFPWFFSSEEIKDYVFVKLNEAFIKQKRFQIVNRKWLKQILFEQKLASSDLIDKEKAVEVGRLVSAEAIMSCDMRIQRGDSIELVGIMIDTETSLEIWSDDIYLPWDSDQTMAEAAEKLAMKIRQHFPLCKGRVLARKRAKIKVDIGHKDGICDYTNLIVYREDEWDTQVIARARVESVNEDYARALLLSEDKQNMVNVADFVITK